MFLKTKLSFLKGSPISFIFFPLHLCFIKNNEGNDMQTDGQDVVRHFLGTIYAPRLFYKVCNFNFQKVRRTNLVLCDECSEKEEEGDDKR